MNIIFVSHSGELRKLPLRPAPSGVYESGFGIGFKDSEYSYDEILDLPETIAQETGKKFIICIGGFQCSLVA